MIKQILKVLFCRHKKELKNIGHHASWEMQNDKYTCVNCGRETYRGIDNER